MKDDTRAELERIEKELLAQDPEMDFFLEGMSIPEDKNLLSELSEPAFENMDEIKDPEEPLVYCNYSNDYGRDLETEEDGEQQTMSKDDKINVGLMIGASALALGIIAVMIYWLVKFL